MSSRSANRFLVALLAGGLMLAGCSNSNTEATATRGGTLYILTESPKLAHLDPQRNYSSEDMAFASGYLTRTLTQYALSEDANESSNLVPDLATDTGKASNGARTWTFTIKDGVKWQDGTTVRCADFKYGISRTFATNVITDGPIYAISLLDIPKGADGNSKYLGPYVKNRSGQALFDKAVTCEGNKITFNLAIPVTDFNYTVTLSAFAPVQKAKDLRDNYDFKLQSNGPYKIQSYKPKSKLVLVRNQHWDANTDPIRRAYPDRIEYDFSIPQPVITKRLMQDLGKDARAISPDRISPSKLATVFGSAQYAKRRFNEQDQYVYYFAINTTKIPNLKHRQAILAAVNRQALRKLAGGSYAGDYADGFLKPTIGQDYLATGLWDGLLGEVVPPSGNPALAKQLIKESGKKFPKRLIFDYQKSPFADKSAAILISSLARAGIKVKARGLSMADYYSVILDPKRQGEITDAGGWAPDWQNASTVIPELFTPKGGFPLSQYADKSWLDKVAQAKALTDRSAQAKAWQNLNREAAQLGLGIPLRFALNQRLAGSKVSGTYIWAPYSSWPYATLSVQN